MNPNPVRIGIITASTREGRFGPVVARWFTDRAGRRADLTIDSIDLAEVPLPVVHQAHPVTTGEYPSADVRAFAERIGNADAYVIVTPEYNHSFPASLKLAIDSVYLEWQAKPVGFVSYGGFAGGLRAVEPLRCVFAELHAATIRETVSFYLAPQQFDEHGEPHDRAGTDAAATALLDQLTWWAKALRHARAESPYPG
ncbi:NADPH-dependent FMN reductase [Amycolatopsis nigrescens]|uniref:NADPH-dependent FMN reductase n=1 Tax=Amycolatopsis nigrescens TaxID=381445 RepID=UPI000365F21A|nr:NAD(P)H-dependent oxidoreductase [Amycolatopsis nigrescens]